MAASGNTVLTLGNIGSNIVQFGGNTAGGTVAQGTVTGTSPDRLIDNVSGTGSFSGNNLVLNYAADAAYDYLRVANSSIAVSKSLAFTGDADLQVASGITGLGGVVKQGSGTVTLLSATSDYTGTTSVTGGTLALSGSAVVGTGPISVGSGGTFDVSATTAGNYTVTGTLQGAGGAGSVVGDIIMDDTGGIPVLAATGAPGTLTLGNDLTFNNAGDLNIVAPLSNFSTNPAIKVNGSLTLGFACWF